jgi:hypothetical protein
LVVAAVDFGGQLVNGLRIKAVPKNKKAAAPPPVTDSDAPAITNTEAPWDEV